MRTSRSKIKGRDELQRVLKRLRGEGKKIVFTNGCFDLLHPGHVRYLEAARAQGDLLVVALNSDSSVGRLKGPGRPILPEQERCEIIGALGCVDYVTTFQGSTPAEIIEALVPDVLVKGGDWPVDRIVGREVVEANSGKVVSIDFEQEFSTSRVIERVRRALAGSDSR